jgi:hypothetical protein
MLVKRTAWVPYLVLKDGNKVEIKTEKPILTSGDAHEWLRESQSTPRFTKMGRCIVDAMRHRIDIIETETWVEGD